MAVMRTHAVQMPPPVAASPGLPPVDPVKGRFSSMLIKPTRDELGVGHPDAVTGATAMEATVADEPYLPFEPPLPIDSSGLESTSGGLSPGQGVAPRMPPDLAEFLEVRTALKGSSNDEGKDWHAPDPTLSRMDFSPSPTATYEHSNGSNDEVSAKDLSTSVTGDFVEAANRDGDPLATDSLGVDPANETGLPRVTTPARDFRRLPQRVADRPRSEEWTDDELLTLPEAAALFWPDGPITTNTLRTAGRDGTLAITKVAGKFFTTPMAIRRMGQDEAGETPVRDTGTPEINSPRAMFEARLEEARRQGRERKRRQRAAKRSVAPSDVGAGR